MILTPDWSKIQLIAESSNGYLTTKQAEAHGISRTVLKQHTDNGSLIRVCQGYYAFPETIVDELVLIQSRVRNSFYSYQTALYLWGLSDRVPHFLDLSVHQGSNVTLVKRDNSNIRFHYVRKDLFVVGSTEIQTPQGGTVRLYDKERCICDLIHSRKQTDMQLYSQAIKDYFSNRPNTRKLLKYGKQFGIEDKIRTYMEVLL